MATVIALHGFTRGPRHLAAVSAGCTQRGWNCLRPALAPRWLPLLMNDRRHLDRVANRLIDSDRLRGQVVIVGHSAGAAAGSWIAPVLISAGVQVRGLVFVDGNDSPNHLIERSWRLLADIPIRAVMAPPSPCNRGGHLTRFLEEERPGCVKVIPSAGHGDIEMNGAGVYRRACSDESGPREWQLVHQAVMDSVKSLLGIS